MGAKIDVQKLAVMNGTDPHVGRPSSDSGYAMAGMLAAIAIMSIMTAALLPNWTTSATREKEAELIFRGGQYARAIRLYGARFGNAYPPDIDTLVQGRFLRRAYADPMMEDGEFELVRLGALQANPVTSAGLNFGQQEGAETPESERASFQPATTGLNSESGPIVGVRSRNAGTSMREIDGLSSYTEWVFTPAAAGVLGGHVLPSTPDTSTSAAALGDGTANTTGLASPRLGAGR